MAQLLLLPSLALGRTPGDEQGPLGLRWSDPYQLAPTTEQEFASQLAARLGRPAFVEDANEPTLSVTWQGTSERCRVELSLTRAAGVEGTRVIESPSGDCPSLVPALLTVSALFVESYEGARSPEPAPPEPSPAPPAVAAPPRPAPAASTPRSRALLLLSIGGTLSSGFVPKLEIGPAAAATWAPLRHLRFGVEGSLFIGHDYGEGPGLSLDHQRGALLVCGMPLSGRLGLGLCGNWGLHHFSAAGTSLARAEAHGLTAFSVGAVLRAEWQLTRRFWWVGHAGADVATRPLYFYYATAAGEREKLFEQGRINPFFLLALSLEVP